LLFLFFVQDVTHIDGGYRPLVRVNVLDLGLSLAGFQVIMSGRFWVIAEGSYLQEISYIAKLDAYPQFARFVDAGIIEIVSSQYFGEIMRIPRKSRVGDRLPVAE